MNCPRCGVGNPETSAKCFRCGSALVPLHEAETFGGVSVPPNPVPAGEQETLVPSARPAASATPDAATAGPWSFGTEAAPEAWQVNFGPRYRIERLLGQGGMGAVYKAYDKELDRTVALKLVRPGLAVDPMTAQRFKQELLLASKVSHKNILRIHDLGDAGGMKFISMAYVEGHDLYGLLQKEGKLPVERAVRIAKQLCAALQAAHAEGVVHRDFKPQNILLDSNDNVYVSDFGLAKSLEEDAGMTRSGEYLGTPRYMAPEQVEGKKADLRLDLYALGLILYEMVTGDVPFHADSAMQLMYKRVHETPKSPKTLNPDLPDWLVRIIMKCLEKSPERRYASAQEVLEDLEQEAAPVGSRSVQIAIRTVSFDMPVVRMWWWGLGIFLVLAAISMAIPAVRHAVFGSSKTAVTEEAPGKYIAVLPFRVLGNPKDLGYVADGLEEALYAKLFQMKGVRLTEASAAEKVKPDLPLADIGQALGAKLIVQGTLQGSGDKIRAVVTLDDVTSGQRLWTQEFSGVTGDLLTIEDQMYSKLVSALNVKASAEELARASSHPTENIDAYSLYLKGRNAMHGQVDEKTVATAISLYEQAVDKDSSFALAYTGIVDAALRQYLATKDSTWAQKALGAAQQAQNLADNLPETHFALGSVYTATGKTAEAIAELNRALELAPNSDEGYRRLGDAYRAAGQKAEALKAYRKAVEINPYYWFNYNALGGAYLRFGDNQQALVAYQKVTDLAPKNGLGFLNVGNAYYRMGKWDECINAYQKAVAVEPSFKAYSNLGTVYFYQKRYDEAARMFEKAVELSPNQELEVGNLADAYRWLGQKDKAAATYDRAIALAQKELAVNPRNAEEMGGLALYFAKKGDSRMAQQYIRRARTIAPSLVDLLYIQAVVDTLGGKADDAYTALRAALEKGYPVREAQSDPELGPLAKQPQFQQLVAQFGNKK